MRHKSKKRKRGVGKTAATEAIGAPLEGEVHSERIPTDQPLSDAVTKEPDNERLVTTSAESNSTFQSNNQALVDESSSVKGLHFYLHKTHTRGAQIVLIPLAASNTVLASLKNRIIVEFPTIYVLPYPQEQLPSEYITEAEYFKRRRADNSAAGFANDETQGAPGHATGMDEADSVRSVQSEAEEEDERDEGLLEEEGSSIVEAHGAHQPVFMADGTELDQNRLLDVLKQDLSRAAKA
ncbi:MAG: hypothetical protein Q9165_000814 [Trypethelium subeluteriae]